MDRIFFTPPDLSGPVTFDILPPANPEAQREMLERLNESNRGHHFFILDVDDSDDMSLA